MKGLHHRPGPLGRVAALSIFALLIGACATLPKPLYFGLDMAVPVDERAAADLKSDRLLEVDTIRVTDKLVRRDVLIQKNATEFEYYYEAKWVARVPDLVEEKLELEFTPGDLVARKQAGAAVILVEGTLLAFEQVDNPEGLPYAHARIEARFRPETHSRHEYVLERTYDYMEPVDAPGPLPKVVADKLSEEMGLIAKRMVQDANTIDLR